MDTASQDDTFSCDIWDLHAIPMLKYRPVKKIDWVGQQQCGAVGSFFLNKLLLVWLTRLPLVVRLSRLASNKIL